MKPKHSTYELDIASLERRLAHPWRHWRVRYLHWRMAWPQQRDALVRRSWDLTAAACGLLLLAPLWLALALAIKLQDGGPVLYWQQRIGYRGRLFAFPKFRSMRVDADQILQQMIAANQHADPRTFKLRDDPRITPVGRWMRRFSLDEVPQLWCVLRGDMTLVGPRPPLPREVVLYGLDARQRLEAMPGLTCIWQISGRSEIAFPEQLQMDLDYIRRRSLGLDLHLLARTIPAVLFGRGAY